MNRSGTAARRVTAALLGLGLAATVAAAQVPKRPALDPLAEAKSRQAISDQKAETEVLSAIADADRQAKTSPVKAVQALKAAQVSIIDLSPGLSAAARKSLTDRISRKIAALEGKPLPNAGAKPDPIAAGVKIDRRAAFDSYTAELRDVKAGVDRYAKFKAAGMTKEAERELAGLARAYPNNPSVILLQERNGLGGRVEDSVAFSDLAQKRMVLAMKDIDRSALPASGDIEFPKDFAKTKDRIQTVKLTENERKIVEALDKPMTVDWNGRPLDEALQEMSNTLGQKLFLDKKSLEDLGIDLRKGVNLQANNVTTRTVLRQLLAAHGLTFVIKDEVLQVVDVERAKNMLTTRVYYLGDVVQGVGPFGNATRFGPFLDFQQTMANADTIVKTITSSIDPLSWKEKGGPCTVTFHYPSMSIIVRASAEVHAMLGSKMGGGR